MDTGYEAYYSRSKNSGHPDTHLINVKDQNGHDASFTVELLRQIMAAYQSLSREDKRTVKKLIKRANESGLKLGE